MELLRGVGLISLEKKFTLKVKRAGNRRSEKKVLFVGGKKRGNQRSRLCLVFRPGLPAILLVVKDNNNNKKNDNSDNGS